MKKRRDSPPSALVPVRPRDSVDILERVLTQGAVIERADDDPQGEPAAGDGASLRVSIGGIELLNIQTDLSWRSLDEPDEPRPAAE